MVVSTQPLISVLVPCYNTERYLCDCLESIRQQSYAHLEVLLLDDCSTDGTLAIAREYEALDSRFRLYSTTKNTGIAAVRNMGLEWARGEFITSLDGDDVYLSADKLAAEYQVILEHDPGENASVIAFSNVNLIDANGAFLSQVSDTRPIVEGRIYKRILARDCFIPRDYLCHRSIYEKTGRFDEDLRIYEDWDYKIRLAAEFPFHYSRVVGIGYRQHGKGLSSANRLAHMKAIWHIRCHHTEKGIGFGPALRRLWKKPRARGRSEIDQS